MLGGSQIGDRRSSGNSPDGTGVTSRNGNLRTLSFAKGRVDVFDPAFNPATLSVKHSHGDDGDDKGHKEALVDKKLPPNFVPFNVQAIGNDIVVTYALHEVGSPVETPGPGLGLVNIYSSSGRLAASGTWRLVERSVGWGCRARNS